MQTETLQIGQILEVTTSAGIHYEKVIQVDVEILTEDMPNDEADDVSTQGLTENWQYRPLSDAEITKALNFNRKVTLTDDHCICQYDQYGGATNPKCLIHGS